MKAWKWPSGTSRRAPQGVPLSSGLCLHFCLFEIICITLFFFVFSLKLYTVTHCAPSLQLGDAAIKELRTRLDVKYLEICAGEDPWNFH